jgi:hypothetical protein
LASKATVAVWADEGAKAAWQPRCVFSMFCYSCKLHA